MEKIAFISCLVDELLIRLCLKGTRYMSITMVLGLSSLSLFRLRSTLTFRLQAQDVDDVRPFKNFHELRSFFLNSILSAQLCQCPITSTRTDWSSTRAR
ncbi:unnamed protein product [Amoebophrya sp. A120]|nr:unnamed protein product [Amoebophrya sp. A120]|eukprot:GSA120T00005739001.1